MISNFFEIFLLSIVQGISEFLPISSAAHLILVSNIYEFKNQSLLIDISLHLGSLLAILFYFRKDIFDFNKNLNLFYKIAISTMPLVVVGYFLYSTEIIYQLRNIQVIAWSTLFFGILKSQFIAVFALFICGVIAIFQYFKNTLTYSNLLALILLYFVASIFIAKSDESKGEMYFSFWGESLSILSYLFLVIMLLIF